MPNQPVTLPTTPLEHAAMDYAALRQEGIRHLERMAGELWTDFNAHDPGITVLEQLCYAITDLGYRIAYELPDILAGDGVDAYQSLHSPARILTSRPVTLLDLRKVILDVEGVNNAWIERVAMPRPSLYYHEIREELRLDGRPRTTDPVHLKGLYRILIEKSDLLDIDGTTVQRDVARRVHANRNLGEDFAEIVVLDPQLIQVEADIEIGPVDDTEEVLVQIYQAISEYLSPSIHFATLAEMLESGKRIDEIFTGPLLEHGFIDSDKLQRLGRRTTVYTSDLIHEIMDIPGVRTVRNIAVVSGGRREPWALPVEPDRTAKLDLDGAAITLRKGPVAVQLDGAKVRSMYIERLKQSSLFPKLPAEDRDLESPRGRARNIASYYSLLRQLPAVYGVGELGLADSATPQRKAAAKQLKAYLLLFDQLLANYFAQLTHAKDLLSFASDAADAADAEPLQSYFSHMIDDPALGLDELRRGGPAEHAARLRQLTEATVNGTPLKRRNRFLNHLLARFAENFSDYSLILFGAMPPDASPEHKLMRDKQEFLRRYPRISSARGTAFNYLQPRSDTQNLSGLEERVRCKLGFSAEDGERFYLIEHILLRPMAADTAQLSQEPGWRLGQVHRQVPLLANTRRKDPYSLQLSFLFPNWPVRFQSGHFKEFVERTLKEETPAHLIPYIYWLDRESWRVFEDAYTDWLDKHRHYWTQKLGL